MGFTKNILIKQQRSGFLDCAPMLFHSALLQRFTAIFLSGSTPQHCAGHAGGRHAIHGQAVAAALARAAAVGGRGAAAAAGGCGHGGRGGRAGPSSPFAFSFCRTRITTCYAYRVEAGPYFVPGLSHIVARSRRPWARWGCCSARRVRPCQCRSRWVRWWR